MVHTLAALAGGRQEARLSRTYDAVRRGRGGLRYKSLAVEDNLLFLLIVVLLAALASGSVQKIKGGQRILLRRLLQRHSLSLVLVLALLLLWGAGLLFDLGRFLPGFVALGMEGGGRGGGGGGREEESA